MEEEFEDSSNVIATTSANATVDPESDLEEARLRVQLKFDEKTRQLEKSKMLLEEATTTLKKVKHLKKKNFEEDGEGEESETSYLEEQIEMFEQEKGIEKDAEDSFLNLAFHFDDSFLRSLERKATDEKVPKDTTDNK